MPYKAQTKDFELTGKRIDQNSLLVRKMFDYLNSKEISKLREIENKIKQEKAKVVEKEE